MSPVHVLELAQADKAIVDLDLTDCHQYACTYDTLEPRVNKGMLVGTRQA